MMLGDLGARVIKVEAPGHGDDTRGWGPPFVGEPDARRVDVLPLGQPQQGVDRPRPQGRGRPRRPAARWSTGPTCWSRTSAPASSSGSASASSRCTQRNPRLVVLSITGFGHDGPEGGRAGYDQIAQGEAGLMSLTGSGPDDPQRVGVPIADLLVRDVRRVRRRRRAPRAAAAPASAPSSAPRCSPRSSACTPSRAPGGPWPARSAARRATTTRRSRRTGCSTAATARCRSRSAARACGDGFCDGFGLDPARRGPGHQPRAGRPTASGSSRSSRRPSPTGTPSRCSPGSPRSASRPARCAPSTRSTRGTRPRARGCWSTSSTRRSGG